MTVLLAIGLVLLEFLDTQLNVVYYISELNCSQCSETVPNFEIIVRFQYIQQCTGFAPLPSTRQHLSYGDCLKVKRKYYWIV